MGWGEKRVRTWAVVVVVLAICSDYDQTAISTTAGNWKVNFSGFR
jgi:hypothetical protein